MIHYYFKVQKYVFILLPTVGCFVFELCYTAWCMCKDWHSSAEGYSELIENFEGQAYKHDFWHYKWFGGQSRSLVWCGNLTAPL